MSIANYGDLSTAVGSYLNRSDLASYIPDFIRQGQLRVFYGSDDPYPSVPLRIPAMQVQTSGTAAGTISFPTRFLEAIRLAFSDGTNSWTLDYVSPSQYTDDANTNNLQVNDYPRSYTYLNNSIVVAPATSSSYTLDYYAAFAAFTADADTDWILTNHPSIYLFAALIESAPFLGDQTMIPAWYGFFKSQISALNRSVNRAAPGSLMVRPR